MIPIYSLSHPNRNTTMMQIFYVIFLSSIFRQSSSFVVAYGKHRSFSQDSRLFVSALMPPADLTPAVDKYVSLPLDSKLISSVQFMTAKGPSPEGPEPFGLVSNELQPLSDYVKELLVSENPVLTMAASHFFDQVYT